MHRNCRLLAGWASLFICLVLSQGCGPPDLHPVKGKVTLGGKSYARLLVYFRPINQQANAYTMGVGETDAEGNLGLRSTAGDGLAAGRYRVHFSCPVASDRRGIIQTDEKADDNRSVKVVEQVPGKYADPENSPVEFEIESGENLFEFDIPTK